MNVLDDLHRKSEAPEPFSREDAARVMASPDLVEIGAMAERVRTALHGDRVTYGRVCAIGAGPLPASPGRAGEVRLTGRPASADDARARVRAAKAIATGLPLTAFSLADLVDLAGGDHLALADLAAALRADGLDAVAEAPIDRLGDTENAVEIVRAIVHGGLGAWRATNDRAGADQAIELADRACVIQAETGAFKAFAPLARTFSADMPSTGYDDVRTVAVTRLVCRTIGVLQVDWPLYGPKLAQVAIGFGADDVDGIAADDDTSLGPRRAPAAEIERQIRSAMAVPIERDGRYEPRP
jgi:aminodeoxyfutalosine synthase